MIVIEPAQLQLLLQAVNRRTPFGDRDFWLIQLLAYTGLRVAELCGLDVSDVWHDGRPRSVLFVRAAIVKGNRSRSVPLCQAARDAIAGLMAFLKARGFSTAPSSPLLVLRQHRRISIRLVQQIVQQLRQQAGLDVPATPHSLRHFFATQLIERTQDVVATSRLLRPYTAEFKPGWSTSTRLRRAWPRWFRLSIGSPRTELTSCSRNRRGGRIPWQA